MASDKPRLKVDATPRKAMNYDPRSSWWEEDDDALWRGAFFVAKQIADDQKTRRAALTEFFRLYKNRAPSLLMRMPDDRQSQRRVTYNVVKACINTACAKISKNKPKPMFLTSEGDYSLQQKAKKLTRYLDGLFAQTDIYVKGQTAFRDCCLFDGGALRILIEGDPNKPETRRIVAERTMVDEILIDENEAYYGEPQQLHQRRFIARGKLLDMFGSDKDKRQKIMDAPDARIELTVRATTPSMVEVVESWHLPSRQFSHAELDVDDAERPKTDGCHAISIDGCTLLVEPYYRQYFPFVFMHWEEPVVGFWGGGIAEELAGLQGEINELLRRIQITQKFACAPRIAVPMNANINTASLNNDPKGSIVKYTGPQPPTSLVMQGVSPEVYEQLERYYQRSFEITGISAMAAQSKKPQGLDSGVALREFQDIETERFVLIGQRWEAFFMRAARMMIDLSRDLYRENPKLAVAARSKRFIESIKWKDVDLDDDQFDMTLFPVSMLPSTPAGRLQTVTDLVQAGFVEREQAMDLLDFPDTEDFISLATAGLRDARMVVDHMKQGGDFIPPEPFMNLTLARSIAQSEYLRGKIDNVREVDLQKLRDFMDQCSAMLAPPPPPPVPVSPSPPPQGTPPGGGGLPMGPPSPMSGPVMGAPPGAPGGPAAPRPVNAPPIAA